MPSCVTGAAPNFSFKILLILGKEILSSEIGREKYAVSFSGAYVNDKGPVLKHIMVWLCVPMLPFKNIRALSDQTKESPSSLAFCVTQWRTSCSQEATQADRESRRPPLLLLLSATGGQAHFHNPPQLQHHS